MKGSASRAFRLPSYTDLYYHDPANFGNPNLHPERAWDFEGGLLWNPGGRFKSEVTIFERRDRDVIDYVRASSSSPYMAENIQKLNFTGVEASVELRLPIDGHLQISYTGLHGIQESLNGLQTKYTFNYPNHDATVAWSGRLPGKFIARIRIGVVDRYASDPYALWDAAVAMEFGRIAAHLGLSNITDSQYEEIPGVIMPGRSVVFGMDLFWHRRRLGFGSVRFRNKIEGVNRPGRIYARVLIPYLYLWRVVNAAANRHESEEVLRNTSPKETGTRRSLRRPSSIRPARVIKGRKTFWNWFSPRIND